MEETEHALLNRVVLKYLFELMKFDAQDFTNYRLVCSTWEEESRKIWRENAWLDVGYVEDYDSDFFAMFESDKRQLKEKPFRKYKMHNWEFRHSGEASRSGVRRFWNNVGPCMTHLQISGSIFYGVWSLRQILFQFTRNLIQLNLHRNIYECPTRRRTRVNDRLDLGRSEHQQPQEAQKNLKELKIFMLTADHEEINGPYSRPPKFPLTWMELIINFPNIEILELIRFGSKGYDETSEIVKATETLRKEYAPNEYLANLKELKLEKVCGITVEEYNCPAEVVACLERLQFPLKTLSFDIGFEVGSERDMGVCKQLLQTHANSLETLCLTSTSKDGSFLAFEVFPLDLHLQKVTYLKLSGFVTKNLLLLKQLPNLKTLLLIHCNDDAEDSEIKLNLKLDGFTHESLEEFSIDNQVFSAKSVRRMGKLFPNLKKLRLGLRNDGFKLVCEYWSSLESLTIHPFLVNEKGFLGVEGVQKFCHPNITSLQRLKFFGMGNIQLYVSEKPLTSSSILYGILLLENLEDAQVRLSSKICHSTSEILKKKFPECLVRFRFDISQGYL